MTRLTFPRTTPTPPCVGDWEALARFAQGLLDQRVADYPPRVADGRMTAAEAERGVRIMRAIAAQWHHACSNTPLPDPADYPAHYGASWAEMLADLATIATRTAQRRAAAPTHAQTIELATLAAALHWHQQPTAEGAAFPHIWQAADHAHWARSQQQRARAA